MINPSEHESFSRVIYESWMAKVPIIVNSNCYATSLALKDSKCSGFMFDSENSLQEIFKSIDKMSQAQTFDLGMRGFEYAKKTANFDKAVNEIESRISENFKIEKAVIIVAVNIFDKDAIGNDVISQYRFLKENGFNVYLYATGKKSDKIQQDFFASEGLFDDLIKHRSTTIIYHHSIYDRGFEFIFKRDDFNSKFIIKYHNITPKEFFTEYNFVSYFACNKGREQLKSLLKHKNLIDVWADSDFNKKEILDFKIFNREIKIIPPFLSKQMYEQLNQADIKSDTSKIETLSVLFVGRIVPNKGHFHLLNVLKSYLENYDENIILNLVGGPLNGKYYRQIVKQIKKLKLQKHVFLFENVSDKDISKFYKDADVFLLMSEHEGFCVPVIEAQINDLPVVALNRGAVGNVIGENQLLFQNIDYNRFSTALYVIKENFEIRNFLIESGRANLERFQFDFVKNNFLSVCSKLLMESKNA